MDGDRFFATTRGKIVTSLRKRRAASAVDLAAEFGVTPNAIRQHLSALERDGLVEERPVKRGPTKPTFEFSLTAKAETLFPHRYDKMLDQVLSVIRERGGQSAVDEVFTKIGQKSAQRLNDRLGAGDDPAARVAGLTAALRESGVDAEFEQRGETFIIREHNCPYANTVTSHPEVCSVIHTVLDEVIGGEHTQVESLATGGKECRFELQVLPKSTQRGHTTV